jgi:hypothetical protein
VSSNCVIFFFLERFRRREKGARKRERREKRGQGAKERKSEFEKMMGGDSEESNKRIKVGAQNIPASDKDDANRVNFPFPYGKPWTIQEDLMQCLYSCINDSKIGIFESPTGTVTKI